VLPIRAVAARVDDVTQEMRTALPNADSMSSLQGTRMMVVDDEEDARALMRTALGSYGADVVAVGSAGDALAEIERHIPDVIVSDIGMPHEDGYALIRRVRARAAAEGGSVPAIAVTAYASQHDRAAAESAGYQAHVAKPFEPAEVASLIAHLAGITNHESGMANHD